jgi:hypothetical protein
MFLSLDTIGKMKDSTPAARDKIQVFPIDPKFLITAKIKEFSIPPITDGLVIGKDAAIGVSALKKALKLLIPEEFDHIEVTDDMIGSILLKSSITRRISQERILPFILNQVKPFMVEDDIIHLQLDVEITITQEI